MTAKEDRERIEKIERCIRRAASIGIDTRNLKAKSLTAFCDLFEAIDKCMDEGEKYRKEAAKYRVNPSNLERYGIARSTINANPVFRKTVRYYEEAQDKKYIIVKRSELETLRDDNESLRLFNDNAVDIGLENQRLREKIEELERRNKQLTEAYIKAVSSPVLDFNSLLKPSQNNS